MRSLSPFAAHQHVSQLELQVFQLQVDDLRDAQRPGIEDLQHGAIAAWQAPATGDRPWRAAALAARCSTSSAASDLGSTFHCRGVSMLSVGSSVDVAVEQQVLVEMPQRRELARHAAPVHAVREQRIEEVAHILPPRLAQRALALQQKLRRTAPGPSGRPHAERRQPLLDLEVVEEGVQQPQIGIGTLHEISMSSVAERGNDEEGTGGQRSGSQASAEALSATCLFPR